MQCLEEDFRKEMDADLLDDYMSMSHMLWEMHLQSNSQASSSTSFSSDDSSDASANVSKPTSKILQILHEKVTIPIVSSFKPKVRPFNSYPIHDPHTFAKKLDLMDNESVAAYETYHQEMLKKEDFTIKSNPNMARNVTVSYDSDTDEEDDRPAKKMKQNDYAKKSRVCRKRRAHDMEIRCSYLEVENEALMEKLDKLLDDAMTKVNKYEDVFRKLRIDESCV